MRSFDIYPLIVLAAHMTTSQPGSIHLPPPILKNIIRILPLHTRRTAILRLHIRLRSRIPRIIRTPPHLIPHLDLASMLDIDVLSPVRSRYALPNNLLDVSLDKVIGHFPIEKPSRGVSHFMLPLFPLFGQQPIHSVR